MANKFTESDRAYTARLDHAARRAARRAEIASNLQARFINAALDKPDVLVPTPGSSVAARSIGYLLHDTIDEGQLAALIRDAAQGADVQVHASLLLSVLAHQWADDQADLALEKAEQADDGPDPNDAYDRSRDNALEGLS